MDQMQKLVDEMAERDDDIYRVIFEAEPISKSCSPGRLWRY